MTKAESIWVQFFRKGRVVLFLEASTVTCVNLSGCFHPRARATAGQLLRGSLLVLAALSLQAQETPHPNRLAWLSIFPEPLPEGVNDLSIEGTSQFLRPDRRDSPDGRSHAELEGEDWQLTSDLAVPLGPGRLNLRTRLTYRSAGIMDRAIMNWHDLLGVDQGGRNQVPAFLDVYHLERDGVVVFDLQHPRLELQGLDLAYLLPWGDRADGGRIGSSVQLPTGGVEELQSSGGVNFLAGVAVWHTHGSWRFWAQGEDVWISLPQASPLRAVVDRGQFWRAWAGAHVQGPGGGFWRGFGLDISWAYTETPYFTKLVRMDKYGLQQTWMFNHERLPRWRFGFTEKGGTFTNPEITFFATYRFAGTGAPLD